MPNNSHERFEEVQREPEDGIPFAYLAQVDGKLVERVGYDFRRRKGGMPGYLPLGAPNRSEYAFNAMLLLAMERCHTTKRYDRFSAFAKSIDDLKQLMLLLSLPEEYVRREKHTDNNNSIKESRNVCNLFREIMEN